MNKKVSVKISSSNYKWYKDKGYEVCNGKIIEINIEDITKSSSVILDVKCDECGNINALMHNRYINNIAKNKKYFCKKCGIKNAGKTNIIKYGSKSPLTDKKIIEKTKETMINKFGVDNISKADYIKEERSKSMKINTNKYNEIINNKYGSNVSKLDWIKEKKKLTTLKNWGVENPSQNSSLFEKAQKTGKKIKLHDIGLYYRGTYEKDFLDYCQLNNILVEKGPSISFIFEGKKKYYHSDFYIKEKNLIIEVKSTYYYEKFKKLNIEKEKSATSNGYNFIFIIDKNYFSI